MLTVNYASKVRLAALALAMLLSILSAACKETGENEELVAKPDINQVVERNAPRLMAIPGVTGVAVSATEDSVPCVMVLILEDSDEIRSMVPDTLEGHPVTTLVSGTIEPLSGDSGG